MWYGPLRAVCWHLVQREIKCGQILSGSGRRYSMRQCVVCLDLIAADAIESGTKHEESEGGV